MYIDELTRLIGVVDHIVQNSTTLILEKMICEHLLLEQDKAYETIFQTVNASPIAC